MIGQLGLGKTVAVGHSMGGLAVLQLAATYPECVAAVILIEPAPFVSSPGRLAAIEVLLSSIETGDLELRRQLLRERHFLPTSDKKIIEEVLEVMMAAPDHVAINAMRGIEEFDALAAATQCKVPALHLAATPPLNPPHRMSEWLPHVVNGWTVGAGHFNQLEVPDQVNGMIEGFLKHHV
jgi:pimeloyl-ACP methyl ester carboxylesterase